jgi:hypothetical protein
VFGKAVVLILAEQAEYLITKSAHYRINWKLEAEWARKILKQLVVLCLTFFQYGRKLSFFSQ